MRVVQPRRLWRRSSDRHAPPGGSPGPTVARAMYRRVRDTALWAGFGTPLFPDRAFDHRRPGGPLYFFLLAVSVFFLLLIAGLVLFFAIKLPPPPRCDRTPRNGAAGAGMVLDPHPVLPRASSYSFGERASISGRCRDAGRTRNIYVVGKQWMWKFQHPEGQREINELHVPVAAPIKLVMTSEDVIHDFSFPISASRDVLPGRYTQIWFEPTKPGVTICSAPNTAARTQGMTGEVVVRAPTISGLAEWRRARGLARQWVGEKLFAGSGVQYLLPPRRHGGRGPCCKACSVSPCSWHRGKS